MSSAPVSIRGFRDVLPPESERAAALESLARAVFHRYGFREIRLPTLEYQELFVKATGETTDIVEKEMFQLEDQGGRKLALRPEGTPGVVRAFLNHHLRQEGGLTKLFYIGDMFRAERPQAGRYREFEQIGAECLGNPHPAADVESMLALKSVFDAAGLEGKTELRLNNIGCDFNAECRPRLRSELREYLRARLNRLCANCQRRLERNPLRALDCKIDGPAIAAEAPRLKPCAECSNHADAVSKSLNENNCPHVYPDHGLVRGLDYYTRTVFEFRGHGLGAQDALAGGGRYDGLVASMGGPATPAVGWALGLERTLIAASAADPEATALRPYLPKARPDAFVAVQSAEEALSFAGMGILERLRKAGLKAEGGMFSSSLKAQMREAGRQQARRAVIVGPRELALEPPRCILKEMEGGTQREVEISKIAEAVAQASGKMGGAV